MEDIIIDRSVEIFIKTNGDRKVFVIACYCQYKTPENNNDKNDARTHGTRRGHTRERRAASQRGILALIRALRASGTTIRPWRRAGLKSGFKLGTIYPRSCVFVTRVKLWSRPGPGCTGPGVVLSTCPLLPLPERCTHTHIHTRGVYTRGDGRSIARQRRHRLLSCFPSAFDPVDLRSSHGATLAVAGVRMPKGDGRGRDAARGRRARRRCRKQKEDEETVEDVAVSKGVDLVWKEEG